MSKKQQLVDVIDFARLRETYRLFFQFVMKDAKHIQRGEEREQYVAERHYRLFLPLIGKFADYNEFRRSFPETSKTPPGQKHSAGSEATDDPIREIGEKIKGSDPCLLGCHYRAVGLKKLRNSRYYPTEHYHENVRRTLFGRQKDAASEWGRIVEEDPGFEKHLGIILKFYFSLFRKGSTINEWIFSSDHPRGPIALAFPPQRRAKEREGDPQLCERFAMLDLRNPSLADAVTTLEAPLMQFFKRGPAYLGALFRSESDFRGGDILDLIANLQAARDAVVRKINKINKGGDWWQPVREFFSDRIPRGTVAGAGEASNDEDLLTLLQAYCLYKPFSGPFLYTFPTSAQADLPASAWTLMTNKRVPAEQLGDLQRVSELIYREIIGEFVADNCYRVSLEPPSSDRGDTLRSILRSPELESTLVASFAASPVPPQAVGIALMAAQKLPLVNMYEGRRSSFLFVLTHQDFLASYFDQITANRPLTWPPAAIEREKWYTIEDLEKICTQCVRSQSECLYDDFSVDLFLHGLRINADNRSWDGHLIPLVYPPYDTGIIGLRGCFGGGYKYDPNEPPNGIGRDIKLWKAIQDRKALVAVDPVRVSDVLKSSRIKYIYEHLLGVELDGIVPEALAEALTFAHSELVVLYCDEPSRVQVYHRGEIVLESEHNRWHAPRSRKDGFREGLRKACDMYVAQAEKLLPAGPKNVPFALLRDRLVKGLLEYVEDRSRSREGALLVFYPGEKPPTWQSLDCAASAGTVSREPEIEDWISKLLAEDGKAEFWGELNKMAGHADGAVVFSLKEGTLGQLVTRIRVVPVPRLNGSGSDRDRVVLQALQMKAVQTIHEYSEVRSMGTKHGSAFEYAMMNPNGFAVAVSVDGPVTLFYSLEAKTAELKKLYEKSAELFDEGGELAGWNRYVVMKRF